MNRIAVIADIHANPFALEAVLADIADRGVDETVVAGDLVGRGPLGSSVVQRVQSENLKSVRGNHEDYMIAFKNREVPEEWLEIPEWSCARWMAAELSEDDYLFIESLPFTMTAEADSNIRIVHGSPRSNNEGIGPWTDRESLVEHLDSVEEPVLVCAHTHRPGVWQVDERMIVNVGSVGLPFNKDSRAQYALFEGAGSTWDVELVKVDYDRQQLLEAYDSTGFLAEGGATSLLLKREVEEATPFLVPFLRWAEVVDVRPTPDAIPEFLDFHRPDLSLREQYERLMALTEQ